jgi:hypothetical protein
MSEIETLKSEISIITTDNIRLVKEVTLMHNDKQHEIIEGAKDRLA